MTDLRRVQKKPVQHPSTEKLFRGAAERFMEMRKRHSVASDLMWAGTLGSHFTKAELALLGDYLSPHDRALVASVNRANR